MSNRATLARPYAKAAFDMARDRQELAAWGRWLQAASLVVEDDTVAAWLTTPGLDRNEPVRLCAEVAEVDVDGLFGRFLGVLARNGRLSLMPDIAQLFGGLREEAEGRLEVRVVSAVALEDEQAKRLSAALRKRFDCDIELHNDVDAGVLGGAVIYAGDEVIDGSLRGRLERLQRSLA